MNGEYGNRDMGRRDWTPPVLLELDVNKTFGGHGTQVSEDDWTEFDEGEPMPS